MLFTPRVASNVTFTYDKNGNILAKREYGFTLMPMERMLCEAEAPVVHKYRYEGDKLLSLDGEECAYNDLGCPTTYLGKALSWNESGKMTSFAIDADTTATFAYDIMGKRISKQVGEAEAITFTYDGNGNLLSQSNGVKFLYDHAGIMGMTYGGNTYLYRKNIQGDVIALLNAEGKVIATYKYDAWGNHTVKVEEALDSGNFWQYNEVANLNPIRYRSYYYDTETGLYYLQARYYDPVACRFISRDDYSYLDPETVNGLNLFAYCGNNPVMCYDPSGHKTKWWQWALFAVGVALVTVAAGLAIFATGGAAAFGVGALIGSLSVGAAGAVVGGAIGYATGGVDGILGGALAGFGIGAIIGFVVGGLVGYSAATTPATKVHSVYISKTDDAVTYVGRTNNISRRAAEHAMNGKGVVPQEVARKLTLEQARGLEQALINKYGMIKNGGTLINKINSIAATNPIYAKAVAWGKRYLLRHFWKFL